jgi:rfaE bifunctional protein kinase chain/domain
MAIQEKKFLQILDSFSTINPLCVMGDIGVDKYTHGEVKRISPEAPVPVLEVSSEWLKLGLAANVSDNLSTLKVKSTLCGVVGEDKNGDILEDLLEDAQVSTWGLIREQSRQTTFKERVTTATQQICRIDYETKASIKKETEEKIISRLEKFASEHSALIIEDYGKGFFSEPIIQNAIKVFKKEKKLVTVDPSRTTEPSWYRGASLLKPNFLESQLMMQSLGLKQTEDVEYIVKALHEKLSVDMVVVTLGAKGMAFFDSKNYKLIPTMAREVYDVSGAGDTVIATLTTSLVAGASLEEAVWIANCAAGVVVGKKGTATVTQKELFGFFQDSQKK